MSVEETFSPRMLAWHELHGRKNLPWQQDINAYRVWISEIMLQQTQVATVIDYFQRFMQRFPTVEILAAASDDEVLHYWSGLGYYSRARNLHKAAKIIVDEFAGELPKTVDALCTLPGIGRSTAGAISSIAYKERASILDGNVKRVIARHRGISGWPGKTATLQALWLEAEKLTPAISCNIYSQAMMDLGASCCSRSSPNCEQCPIADDCYARINDCINELPGKKTKKILPVKSTRMLVLRHQDELYLNKRPALGIWPSLYSFIEVAIDEDIDRHCIKLLGPTKYQRYELPGFRHSFSHYHLDIHIELINCEKKPQSVMEDSQQLWYNMQQKANVGLAAPVSRIIKSLEAAP